MLAIYTYGHGDLLKQCFNALSLTMGGDSYQNLIRLFTLFAGTWAIYDAIAKRNMLLTAKWVMLRIMVVCLLFTPKTGVEIIDKTQEGHVYQVDHVPLVVAFLASTITAIGVDLTELLEKNFTDIGDLRYGKTGMVFASNLVSQAGQFQITDPRIASNLKNYVQQCVFYDLLLGKYSIKDLLNASPPDYPQGAWSLIINKASPARAFLYQSDAGASPAITICQDGVALINHEWDSAIGQAASRYGAQIMGNVNNAKEEMLKYLQLAYNYLTNVSETGAALMQQNLLASSINEALQHFAATTNSATAMETYAFHKAQMQKRMNNWTIGNMAAYWLPLMKTSFEAILYGVFILVSLMCLFPFGGVIFKNYLMSLIWLQMWPPLYAIINLVVSMYAHSKSSALVIDGLSLEALGGMAQVNADMAGLAGYMTMSVPFLAWGIIKGMGETFTQIAQFVGGTTQAAATTASSEAVSGNLSLGNTQFGNHSTMNTSAFHYEHNARISSGATSWQSPGGGMTTRFADGSYVVDTHGAMSNLPIKVDISQHMRLAASQNAQSQLSEAQNSLIAASEQYQSGFRNVLDYAKHQGSSLSLSDGKSMQDSSGLNYVAQKMEHLTEQFAKENHLSFNKARGAIANASFGFKTPESSRLRLGVEVGGNGSINRNHADIDSVARRYIQDHHIGEMVDQAERLAHEQSTRTSNEEGTRMAQNIAASFDKSNSYRDEVSVHLSKSESFQSISSMSQEQAAAVNTNYTQDFFKWLVGKPTPLGVGTISANDVAGMKLTASELDSYATRYANEKVQQNISDWKHQHGHQSVLSSYDQAVSGIHRAQVDQSFNQAKTDINHHHIENRSITNQAFNNQYQHLQEKISDTQRSVATSVLEGEQIKLGALKATDDQGLIINPVKNEKEKSFIPSLIKEKEPV